MSHLPGIKREFPFGVACDSWCTSCSGIRCKEDVGFLFDQKGKVQGYIIDSQKLREAASKLKLYPAENRRLKNFAPHDGIYKRPLDVKNLISKNPSYVNTVRFSDDILKHLLVGVEGCDDFIRGKRDISKRKGCINLNMKATEVLTGERNVEGIEVVESSGEVYHKNPGTNPLTRGY
jgi:hypothetical protein